VTALNAVKHDRRKQHAETPNLQYSLSLF